MTDKATVEIPAPTGGTVLALGSSEGATIAVGSELIRLDVPGAPDDAEPPPAPKKAAKPAPDDAEPSSAPKKAARTAPPEPPPLERAPIEPAPAAPIAFRPGPPRPPGEKPIASPAVRQRARDAGVDLR